MSSRNGQWPWFAVQVRTDMEKTVNLHLENAGYECFLPVVKCTHCESGHVKEIELPLLSGYIFCRMSPHHRLTVLQTPGVIQIVGVGKTPMPVEEAEMVAIQRAVKSGLPAMPWPYLQVGREARIEEGPLRGLTGIVVKIKSGMKLVLSLSLLQRSVAVEIDRRWISVPMAPRPAANEASNSRLGPHPAHAAHQQVG